MKYVGTNVDTIVSVKVQKQTWSNQTNLTGISGLMVAITVDLIDIIPTVAHHLLVKVKTERWYVLQANQKLSTLLKSVISPMNAQKQRNLTLLFHLFVNLTKNAIKEIMGILDIIQTFANKTWVNLRLIKVLQVLTVQILYILYMVHPFHVCHQQGKINFSNVLVEMLLIERIKLLLV
jgi:hypothetical protein